MLGFFNYFVFQWFFTRLARITDTDTNKVLGYKFIYRTPLTGWIYK